MAAVLPQIAPLEEQVAFSRFDPDFSLVLAAARGRGRLPASGVDFQRAAELAQDHGVVPRVFVALCGKIGAAQLEPLRRLYDANVRKAMLLTRELLRIYEAFNGRGIEVLPYKGPALACQLYGDVAARQFSDLDLLVRGGDVQKARAALNDLGYNQARPLTARQESAHLHAGYEYTFDGAPGRNAVELKWAIVPRFYAVDIDIAQFFARAKAVQIADRPLTTLCPEDALLVLCIHAAKHQWSELSWLCDLRQMIYACDLDWYAVRQRASGFGISRIVEITFLLTEELLEIAVPQMRSSDPKARRLVEALAQKIARRNEHDPESSEYFRTMMQVRERWRDKARFLSRLLMTPGPAEWNELMLPDALFGLYPGVRLGRLIKRLLQEA